MNGDEQMIEREKNPEYLNSFLDYSITILNKSPNSVKEYNYDLVNKRLFSSFSPHPNFIDQVKF